MPPLLQERLRTLTTSFDGRVGIGIQDDSVAVNIHENQRFSLQSVMKLIVATAAMDAIGRHGWRLNDPILVRRQDLSLNVQPLAALVKENGWQTTLGDLIFRAIVDSDSAASDILYARVGGASAINAFLKRSGIVGIRIDRDERQLQTEIVGLTWRPEYIDADRLDRAKKAVPKARQEAAFRAYLRDPRDTATPTGMAQFLYRLAAEKILSPTATAHLLGVMRQTVTFPDRLKAGVPTEWTLAHKTGTSGSWQGMTGTANDAGILTAPNNRVIAVCVFVAESRRPLKEQAALIANIARVVTALSQVED